MKQLFRIFLIVFAVCSLALSQTKNDDGTIEFTATFADQTGAVFALEPVTFSEGKTSAFATTDPNGNLLTKLRPGNYEITLRKSIAPDFRAFITLTKDGPNPKNVRLTVVACEICCGDCPEKSWPKPIELVKPLYPNAGKAFNVTGAVNVQTALGPDGKVEEARAISGHPLLLAVSVIAAKKSTFEPSPANTTHKLVLTYYFTRTKIDESLKRRQSPYLVLVEIVENVIVLQR